MTSCACKEKAFPHERLSLVSPAKLNLFFRVLYKREDGYHEISSLYQTISLYDTLHIRLSKADQVICSDPQLPCDHNNLVTRSRDLFRRKTGITTPCVIELDKKIPMQAGLGGGSSNAATTLWGLNHLFGSPAAEADLQQWAEELGSDVPVFFSSGSAYCTGRGEKVKHVEGLSLPPVFWVAKPKEGLSTPLVYRNCYVDSLPKRDPQESLASFYKNSHEFYNDLEASAFSLFPALATVKAALLELGFSTVVMTGSGSAFFCLGEIKNPCLQSVQFFKVQPIARRKDGWYYKDTI